MSDHQKQTKRQPQYDRILYQRRVQLIDLVIEQGFTISEAASVLKIKLSTAKLIVQRFRKTKTIFCRKDELVDQKVRPVKPKNKSSQRTNYISNFQIPLQTAVETAFPPPITPIRNQESMNWIVFYVPPCQLFSQSMISYSII